MKVRALLIAAALAVIGASIAIGFLGARADHEFDWELFAIVLTGLGTTALAIVTGALAFATNQDVRASLRAAAAAEAQLEIARSAELSRPLLTLAADEERVHTRIEGNGAIYVRLVVNNASGRRAARGTRVLVDKYWHEDSPQQTVTIRSPSLGWPSATEAADASWSYLPVRHGRWISSKLRLLRCRTGQAGWSCRPLLLGR